MIIGGVGFEMNQKDSKDIKIENNIDMKIKDAITKLQECDPEGTLEMYDCEKTCLVPVVSIGKTIVESGFPKIEKGQDTSGMQKALIYPFEIDFNK